MQRVLAELQAHGITEDEIYTRGLTIQTTINQQGADRRPSRRSDRRSRTSPTKQQNMKNALVAVNPADRRRARLLRRPGRQELRRQRTTTTTTRASASAAPGSSFKPYTLATALTADARQASPPGTPLTINSIVDGSHASTIEGTQICNDPSDAAVQQLAGHASPTR